MKTRFYFLLSILLSGIMCIAGYNRAQAQDQVSYGYDLSGNRISRVIKLTFRSAETDEPEEQKIYSEMLKDFNVKIYPNPTKGDLTIETQGLPEGKTVGYF